VLRCIVAWSIRFVFGFQDHSQPFTIGESFTVLTVTVYCNPIQLVEADRFPYKEQVVSSSWSAKQELVSRTHTQSVPERQSNAKVARSQTRKWSRLQTAAGSCPC